jgi:hypothetical protein
MVLSNGNLPEKVLVVFGSRMPSPNQRSALNRRSELLDQQAYRATIKTSNRQVSRQPSTNFLSKLIGFTRESIQKST